MGENPAALRAAVFSLSSKNLRGGAFKRPPPPAGRGLTHYGPFHEMQGRRKTSFVTLSPPPLSFQPSRESMNLSNRAHTMLAPITIPQGWLLATSVSPDIGIESHRIPMRRPCRLTPPSPRAGPRRRMVPT